MHLRAFLQKIRIDPGELRYLEHAYQILMSEHPFRRLHVCKILFNFLFMLVSRAGASSSEYRSLETRRATNTITSQTHQFISVQKLASDSELGRRQFFDKFKMETGMSPKEFILNEKIKIAKRMLQNSSIKICDLAYDLSFSSERHFATIFKMITGQTARDYRSKSPPSPV